MEESHARWKENRHDPKLGRAWEKAIPRVDEQDDGKVNVQHGYGGEDDLDVPQSHAKVIAMQVQQIEFGREKESVDDGGNDVANTKRVEVGTATVEDTRDQYGRHPAHSG